MSEGKITIESYLRDLKSLAGKVSNKGDKPKELLGKVSSALNGEPYEVVRNSLPLCERRESGIFFTGHKLAEKAVNLIAKKLKAGASVADPTCGVGDLLLAAAMHLPLQRNADATLELWSTLIRGGDINPKFVSTAQQRLRLLALSRHGLKYGAAKIDSLRRIAAIDVLAADDYFSDANILLLNPPYGHMDAPDYWSFGKGKIQKAAVVFEKLIREASIGQEVVAILPDVLRSGSRYDRWRSHIGKLTDITSVKTHGRFDEWTDVDVFLLHCKRVKKHDVSVVGWSGANQSDSTESTIKEFFDVRIGPLVAYRSPKTGDFQPFLDTENAEPWATVNADLLKMRRFSGRCFTPPFVVVRRTSNPSDPHRAIPTIVKGKSPVAVENHLIVLSPKDKRLSSCIRLVEQIENGGVDGFLNDRIRCRHLTKSAVQDAPVDGKSFVLEK